MKKILLIDDDIDILHVVKLMLTYHDYIVKTVWKWQFILETIETFSPDLILLDIDLGGADGSEICKKIKKTRATKHIPVILISAHNMPPKYVKECNAQGFISKPFEIPDVLVTLKDNLKTNQN